MEVLIGIILLIAFILIIRLFGAWMLRIDEIIKLQKEMLVEMKNTHNRIYLNGKSLPLFLK